jgi:chromosome segregation ATPase
MSLSSQSIFGAKVQERQRELEALEAAAAKAEQNATRIEALRVELGQHVARRDKWLKFGEQHPTLENPTRGPHGERLEPFRFVATGAEVAAEVQRTIDEIEAEIAALAAVNEKLLAGK